MDPFRLGRTRKDPMDALIQDIRFGLRGFVRAPLFTLSLVLTLALALAAAITTFGVIDAVLGRPLPLDAPDRVFVGWTRDNARGFEHYPLTAGIVDALEDRVTGVAAVGAVPWFGTLRRLLDAGGPGEEIRLSMVAGDVFGALGARAALGSLPGRLVPTRDEQAPLVLSHAYWQRRFGGGAVLGTIVRIEGRAYEIAAVAPAGFEYPEGVEAWAPMTAAILDTPLGGSPFLDLVVRLEPGARIDDVRTTLEREVHALYAELDGFDASQHTMIMQPITDIITGDARPWLRAVGLLVAVLLAVATLNAVVLLLIRALDRARELAMRVAAGATRARLVRQMITENLLLSAVACALALALAAWGLDLLRTTAPPGLPRAEAIRLDARTAAFGAAATLLISTVLSGAVAFATWRQQPGLLLRGGWQVGAGARLRDAVTIGQIAMTVVMLGAAGMLARSLYNLSSLDAGFDTASLVLADVALPGDAYAGAAAARTAFREMVPAVAALPGVDNVSALYGPPFPDGESVVVVTAEGQDATLAASNPLVDYEPVDDTWFATLRPRILRGRGITETDRVGAPLVVVVNRSLAQLFWPGEDAVGRRLKLGGPDSPGEWRTIVGVMEDMRYRRFRDVQPALYFHYEQGMDALAPSRLAVRTTGVGPGLATLRTAVARVAPGAVVLRAPGIGSLLEQPLARPRFHALLLGCFALTALLLTAVGVYGSLGTNVRQRRRELAVRLALGARPAQLLAMVLRRAAIMAAAGTAAGAILAIIALRTIASLLYGVAPADPLTLAAVTLVIFGTAAAAAWIPARSATTTDPNSVLRQE